LLRQIEVALVSPAPSDETHNVLSDQLAKVAVALKLGLCEPLVERGVLWEFGERATVVEDVGGFVAGDGGLYIDDLTEKCGQTKAGTRRSGVLDGADAEVFVGQGGRWTIGSGDERREVEGDFGARA
jgi:hypothetical protein